MLLVGVLCLLLSASNLQADPFSDNEPVKATTLSADAPPPAPTEVAIPDPVVTGAQMGASASRSLWEELRRMYGSQTRVLKGKRTIKSSEAKTTEHHLPGYDEQDINIDGDNYCGQFAMSTLLNGMGIKTDAQAVYKQTNPAGIFTSPPIIVEHLRMSGIDAKMKNQASIKDIAKRIDSGKPVMVLVDSGDGVPHWVCITGYDVDANGQIQSLRMRDSYWGTNGPHTMSVKDFEKAWKAPFGKGLLGDLVTYSNLLVDNQGTCKPSSSPGWYPGNFSTATEDNMASGINDVVTGWKNSSVTQVTGGAAKLILGLPGALTGVAANFLGTQGQKWNDWGKDKMSQDGVGNKILGGLSIVGGTITTGSAKVTKAVADVWSSGTSIIGNGIKKLGSLFS
jgi:hypothetical protein